MKKALCLMVLCTMATMASAETVVYRENFTSPGAIEDMTATNGWNGYANASCDIYNGFKYVSGGTDVEPRSWSDNYAGAPTLGASVNAGADVDDLAKGYMANYDGAGNIGPWLVYTDEYTVTDPVKTVSFYLAQLDKDGTAAPDDAVRVAVKIGTQWYVSDQGWDDPNGSAGNWNESMSLDSLGEAIYCELDFANATWKKLTVNPDVELALGDDATLPTGDVVAFGVYTVGGNSTGQFRNHIDTYQITVPEPATMSLLALGGLAGLIRRRRR